MKKLLSVLLVIMLSVSLGAAVGSVGLAVVAGLILLFGFDFLARKKKKASEQRGEINQDETDGSKCIFGGPSEPKVVPSEEEVSTPRATRFPKWVVRAADIISVMIAMINLPLICLGIFVWLLGQAPHGTGASWSEVKGMEAIIVLPLVGLIFGWIGVGQARSWLWKGVSDLGVFFNGLALLVFVLALLG